MKIFITGGAGFVGRNLTEFLSPRHTVFAPTHAELDLLDEEKVREFLKKHTPDVVIHCANIGATRKTDSLPIIVDHNVRMFLNLARQEQYYERMIFYGSGAEFDKRQSIVQASDDFISPALPVTQYGFSKYLCNHFTHHYPKIINLRIFGIYGKYDDYENRFVSNAICRTIKNLPIVIYRDQVMSFILVDDLVKITEQFLAAPLTQHVFNVCSGESKKLSEIAQLIKEISGKDIPIVIEKDDVAPEYSCDSSKLWNVLLDLKPTEWEEGVKSVYNWYAANEREIDIKKLPN
jgi:UDP-glucose 4-epimerase